jgi:hypothetical protein
MIIPVPWWKAGEHGVGMRQRGFAFGFLWKVTGVGPGLSLKSLLLSGHIL